MIPKFPSINGANVLVIVLYGSAGSRCVSDIFVGSSHGMGIIMGEAVIDEKGRIVIPSEIRVELNLRPEQKLRIEAIGRELILRPSVDAEGFIVQLKGCVSRSKVKPRDLKRIWGFLHPHH